MAHYKSPRDYHDLGIAGIKGSRRITWLEQQELAKKSLKKPKIKHYEEHFNKNWAKDLWEQIGQHCLSGSMGYQL